jgi:hypothetical protein
VTELRARALNNPYRIAICDALHAGCDAIKILHRSRLRCKTTETTDGKAAVFLFIYLFIYLFKAVIDLAKSKHISQT